MVPYTYRLNAADTHADWERGASLVIMAQVYQACVCMSVVDDAHPVCLMLVPCVWGH